MNEVSSLFRPEKNWGFQICSDYGFQKSGKPKVQNSGLDSSGQPNQQKKKEKKKRYHYIKCFPLQIFTHHLLSSSSCAALGATEG